MDNTSHIIVSKHDVLLQNLLKYYENDKYINELIPIIDGKSNISLRVLDWFVTNYAKKHNVSYNFNNILFNVYNDYRLQLKAYNKKLFDPFCRRDRIKLKYKDTLINTTVGQLNFFKWAINNKILSYVNDHLKEIISDMNITQKKNKQTTQNNASTDIEIKSKSEKEKRHLITVSANKTITKNNNVKIILTFD